MAEEKIKHIGYPLPPEMFHEQPKPREDFYKHMAFTELLDIDLKCPHCNELLIKANERKEKRKHT
tara:strand:- start:32 stop:226 length:195 start_codon:yes stop_codon:yes gene_type:complete